jgi:hypothetical protein
VDGVAVAQVVGPLAGGLVLVLGHHLLGSRSSRPGGRLAAQPAAGCGRW